MKYVDYEHLDLDRELDYRRLYRRELQKVTERRDELTACCPFHNDRNPSLSVNLRTGQYHCHACGAEGNYVNFIAELRGLSTSDAFKAICEENSLGATRAKSVQSSKSLKIPERPERPERPEKTEEKLLPAVPAVPAAAAQTTPEKPPKYTLGDYAAEKHLPEVFLREVFRMEQGRGGRNGSWLKLPYLNVKGKETIWRGRSAPGVEPRFRWEPNKCGCIVPYGLWLNHEGKNECENPEKLEESHEILKSLIKMPKRIVLVEGESDTQTLTYLGIPALGIPGASSFKSEWCRYLEAYDEVFIHVEPDQGGQTFLKTTLDRLGRYFYNDDDHRHRVGAVPKNPENAKKPKIPFAVYSFTMADAGAKDPRAFWIGLNEEYQEDGREVSLQETLEKAVEKIHSLMKHAAPLTIKEPDLTEIPGANFLFRMPEGWHMDETGVYQLETKDGKIKKIGEPILITGSYRDADNSCAELLDIRCSHEGKWKTIRVSWPEVFGALGAFGLQNYGVPVFHGSAKPLSSFLWAMQDTNLSRIPLYETVKQGGWRKDGSFMPFGMKDSKRDLKWSDSCHDGLKAMVTKGTLEGWRELVEPYRKTPTIRLLMAAALTPPTLQDSSMRNLWVHLSGPSGTGKTAAMRIAASIWGDPERLPITFDATENAFLNLCRSYNDLPMFINEKQVCSNNFRFDQLVYKAVEGRSRNRLKRDCTLMESYSWHCVFISNGEEHLVSQASHEGVRGRVLELTGAPFSSPLEARGVYDLTWEHYGVAGEKLIHALQNQETKDLRNLMRMAIREILDVEFPDLHRFTGAAAELAASDYLGTLLLFPPKEELTPAMERRLKEDSIDLGRGLMRDLIDGGVETEATRVSEFVQGYILENRPCFDMDTENSNVVVFPSSQREFLGFYRGDYIYLLPAALNKAITAAGFNYISAMELLAREGILERGKDKLTKVVRYNGLSVRMLKMLNSKLFQEQPKSNAAASPTVEQMTLDAGNLAGNA